MKLSAMVLSILLLIPAIGLAQTTWYVPDNFLMIQDAISSGLVMDGDTVIVRPGTYFENINFQGKAITLKSEQGPDVTIIDGSQAGSVVIFITNEQHDSVLDGFTITNGNGYLDPGVQVTIGGGVCCKGSCPVIRNNIIESNENVAFGGGIACYGDAGSADPIISNNTITRNISDKSGGAIFCTWNASIEVSGNEISYNQSGGHGGGICIEHEDPSPESRIYRNLISYNTAKESGGGIGTYQCPLDLKNNIIVENTASEIGGGINCEKTTISVRNDTICNNSSIEGAGISSWSSNITIDNSIFWENDVPSGMVLSLKSNSILNIQSSDFEGSEANVYVESGSVLIWGSDMINEDPDFDDLSNNFHLKGTSPCINRGRNETAPSDDFDGDPRPCMGTADIGADEFTGTHALEADVFILSAKAGGTVNFPLYGGTDNALRNYIIFGSVSGTAPGTPLPGGYATLPINWDIFTNIVIDLINTPIFDKFMGSLDGSGSATATLNLPAVQIMSDMTMSFAYALNKKWDFVSNPINVLIEP